MDWKNELNNILLNAAGEKKSGQSVRRHDQEQIDWFYSQVKEAFDDIKAETEKHGRQVEIHAGTAAHAIDIYHSGRLEFTYAIKVRRYAPTAMGGYNFYRANSFDAEDSVQRYNFAAIEKIDKPRIIRDFMRSYSKHLQTAQRIANQR